MLQSTFCHLPGIGPCTERKLWERGVRRWHDLLDQNVAGKTQQRRDWIDCVSKSINALARRDAGWFHRSLPSKERWRLFAEFRNHCAYLDIETTGLNPGFDSITTIALYDGADVMTFVNGQNLSEFGGFLSRYRLIVTYNGSRFDFPFLRGRFPNVNWQRLAHIDLRWLLSDLGIKGGLKRCERQMGIFRDGLSDIDGFAAVMLWHEYLSSRDRAALETLIAYNVQDVLNLEILMVEAYNRRLSATPFFRELSLPRPEPAPNPYRPDPRWVSNARMHRPMRRYPGW